MARTGLKKKSAFRSRRTPTVRRIPRPPILAELKADGASI
jgi:hypothetical protein